MGINFSVQDSDYEITSQWSYSGFMDFRKRIAKSINIDLEEMEGFSKKHPVDPEYRKIGTYPWEKIKSPIKHFLNHSDHEGHLNWKHCLLIASQLKVILLLWENNGYYDDCEYDATNGLILVAAMEYCHFNKKNLIFC